ncbi:MAG: lipase family protein [Candidatus Gastranaerophilales bacterium]|nr:lipase family protein [Candidatus Gastranaerophilales bacterium]
MEKNFPICLKLSKEIYKDEIPTKIDGWARIDGVCDENNSDTYKKLNFACGAYKKDDEIIIAFRGTNDLLDIITDFSFVIRKIPAMTPKIAQNYYNKIQQQCPNCKIYFTGHSLGGAYAQLICAQLIQENKDCKAITFNAPGMGYVLNTKKFDKSLDYSSISNYVVMNDFIGNFKSHIGYTYYIQPFPLDSLKEDGTLETSHGCILSYNEEKFGPCFSKPEGFGTKESWAIYCYDVKNKEKYKILLNKRIRPKDLENAIKIIQSQKDKIKLKNSFTYKTKGKEYSLA